MLLKKLLSNWYVNQKWINKNHDVEGIIALVDVLVGVFQPLDFEHFNHWFYSQDFSAISVGMISLAGLTERIKRPLFLH